MVNQRAADRLEQERTAIALRVAERNLKSDPSYLARFGEVGRRRCIEDAGYHLQYLEHSVRYSNPSLFTAYVHWARQLLERRSIPWDHLRENLQILRDEIGKVLDEEEFTVASACIDESLSSDLQDEESYLSGAKREPLARAYLSALLAADRRAAIGIIEGAEREGVSIRDLYLDVFQPVQREVGRLWQLNQITVADEHFCTASTQSIMARFYPAILATPRVGRKVVIACVGSELHEIGTRMVADFFEMAGWDTIYLGANTPSRSLVELVCRERPDLIALGVTMTYHLSTAASLIASVRSDDRCSDVRIIAGGYVFQARHELCAQIGADACAQDATEAVTTGIALIDGATPAH